MPRLDQALCDRGLAASRSLAVRLIREGYVSVNGTVAAKPALSVSAPDRITVAENPLTRYVSRGGLKLEEALRAFSLSVKDLVCADIGASTGGFTDCLLRHGAKHVFAVDAGTDQLHPDLKKDPRVTSFENVNARDLDGTLFPAVDLVVMDVSFISQSLLYPAVTRVLKPGGVFLSLIKPQFEAGRDKIGGGGIVRDEKVRRACVNALLEKAKENGLSPAGVIPSPITGGDGNVEYLALFTLTKE